MDAIFGGEKMNATTFKTITIKIVRHQDVDSNIPGFWRVQVDNEDVVIRDDIGDIGRGDFQSFLMALECGRARAIQIVVK